MCRLLGTPGLSVSLRVIGVFGMNWEWKETQVQSISAALFAASSFGAIFAGRNTASGSFFIFGVFLCTVTYEANWKRVSEKEPSHLGQEAGHPPAL
jgi:uncharacterized protein (DUF2062 family)